MKDSLERIPQNRIGRHLEGLSDARDRGRKIVQLRLAVPVEPSSIDKRLFDARRHRIPRLTGRQLLRRVHGQLLDRLERRHFRTHVDGRQERENERRESQQKTNIGPALELVGRIVLVLCLIIGLRHNGNRRELRRIQRVREIPRRVGGPVLSYIHIQIVAVLFDQRVLQVNHIRLLINDELGERCQILNHEGLLVFQRELADFAASLFAHARDDECVGPLQRALSG